MQATHSTRYSPSPPSPLAGRRSPTPPQPMSKRDKRKQQHLTLQQDLQNDFHSNREHHYREQLIALQTDMNLVSQADPYAPEPLEDSPNAISQMIEAAANGTPYQSEMSSLAGKWYTEFLQEVNEAKEAKEIHLTDLQRNHEKRLERLTYECDYKLHLAAEEYDHMTTTLRERLAQSLHNKRQRLMKEKEQLDIADTNALLLNPNQFSITNPTSPGGHTSRKTRLTRHRGEADEGNGHMVDSNQKRKRKGIEDEYGSPSRNGHSTPAERAKAANIVQQTDKVYSINQLFTDKELYFQSHQAQIAARHFFSTSQKEGEANGTNRKNKEEEDKSDDGVDLEKDDDAVEAPGMERTASQSYHLTRSQRNMGPMSGLNVLSDLAEKQTSRPSLPYATLFTHQGKNGTIIPAPGQLMQEELEEDVLRITQATSAPAGHVDSKAIEESLKPVTGSRSMIAPDWPLYMQMHLVDMDPRRGTGVS